MSDLVPVFTVVIIVAGRTDSQKRLSSFVAKGTHSLPGVVMSEEVYAQIAKWMNEELEKKGFLDQYTAAMHVLRTYGQEHLYKNNNGNWALQKAVLDKFKALNKDSVVWSRSDQRWRKRRVTDPPGKRMVE